MATKARQRIQVSKVELVDPKILKKYRDNARRGNLTAIKESLETNGQFRPILVNKGDKAVVQYEILAGNHTWMGILDLEWDKIAVTYVNVNDEDAAKINLADNRTNDLSTYNTEALAKVLERVPDPIGTGYQKEEVDTILAAIRENSEAALQEAIAPPRVQVTSEPEDRHDPFDDVPGSLEGADEGGVKFDEGTVPPGLIGDSEPEDEDEVDFNDALSELQGALTLKEDMDLRGDNYYEIPELRRDMLLDKLPEPFDTWAGKDATPDDGVTHWLWNYGVAAFSGLPCDRATLCFYTYDEKFEGWWDHPAFYTAKVMNNGIKSAVVPDFSFYDNTALVMHVFNVYRAQWTGRFFQEAGIKVIPRLQFRDQKSLDFCLAGIPKNPPILMNSLQNVHTNGPGKPLSDDECKVRDVITEALARLKPKVFVVYSGPPGHRLIEDGHIEVPSGTTVKLIQNYVWKRRGTVFDKKEGIGATGEKAIREGRVRKVKKAKSTISSSDDAGNEADTVVDDAATVIDNQQEM